MFAFKYILPFSLYAIFSLWVDFWATGKKTTLLWDTSVRQDSLVLPPDSIPKDSIKKYKPSYSPNSRRKDRYGDPISARLRRRAIFGDPKNQELNIEYEKDSSGGKFIIQEKIGQTDFRPPTELREAELNKLKDQEAKEEYWKEKSSGDSANNALTGRRLIPKIPTRSEFMRRVFGGDFIEFKPTGFINMNFGVVQQKVANPTLSIRQQSNINFNFDPHANVNLIGKIGEKLTVRGNLDTKASFDFENNFKVEYKGFEEDIIRKIEFGNVSFPLPTTLIQGAQNLFGVTTHFQFGKLSIRSVFGNQRARAETLNLAGRGGAQRKSFEVRADNYDVNRHFFLAHFFRDRYEQSLRSLPVITSNVTVTRVEVYVTNRTNNTDALRNIVAFTDFGESNRALRPNNPSVSPIVLNSPASNASNALLGNVQNSAARAIDNAPDALQGLQLVRGEDFEILRATRRLNQNEFTFHPELGYVSLLTPLKNDEVIAVSYEYTLNGQRYKVGEMTEDYQNFAADRAIFLKLLRPSAIRLDLPTWDLMMKNVYNLNATNINRQNFQLRVVYRDDVTGLDNPSLQEGARTKDIQLLRLMNLDRLNQQNDPQTDGNFDYVENITIDSRNGRIIFPVLEPFGSHLQTFFDPVTEPQLISKYVFGELYRLTQADALQRADKNKFFIKGFYEGTASNDVTLPGLNIAPGSVRVTAGNTPLVEGTDYTVDYSTGKVQIINDAILASGKEIKINYERADLFNFQVRRLFGTRLDYQISKDFNIGATFMNLRERPVITRVNIGDEPTSNSIWGFDISYKAESRFLTRLVDKLPFIQTKEKSTINFYAEFAQLQPESAPLSGQTSMIDDFEGMRTIFNLGRAPHIGWKLGAVPQTFLPGANSNDISTNFRRAKLAWYNVDNVFYRQSGGARPPNITEGDLENHYVRAIIPQEIFQNRQRLQLNTNEIIFDLAYYPSERGPYNYTTNLDPNGNLLNPSQNFGAITRAFTSDVDFDNANIEYVEFWMLDPFIASPNGRVLDGQFNVNNTTGGTLFLNLGSISEDVVRNNRQDFENGLPPGGADPSNTNASPWGLTTRQQFVTNAFDNSGGARTNQDVGWDGLRNDLEGSYFTDYINTLPFSLTPDARARILADPSADNFSYYLGSDKDAANQKVLERYKNYNGLEGNSPISSGTAAFAAAATNLPDNEDLNNDNTLNQVEGYYQYRIDLRPGQLQVGQNYVVDRVQAAVNSNNENVNWYLFRVPVREFTEQIGSINGFKTIRFMRMFMTNFQQPVVLRFAQFQMVSNTWRRYLNDLTDRTFNQPLEPYDPNFTVTTISIEENGQGGPNRTAYVLPPGVIRDRDVTNINNRQINEQSISMCVTELRDRDARAVFKNTNFDFLMHKNLNMYIHAESPDNSARDGEVTAFVRLGTDFNENYYEIEVPLIMTPLGTPRTSPEIIWPNDNQINIAFKELVDTKIERNSNPATRILSIPYFRQSGRYRITVVGNPDLSSVQVVMLGVRNPNTGQTDDRLPKSVCVWMNELRATGFDRTNGWSALARLNVKFADFAQVTSSFQYTTYGFGTLNQKISERTRNNTLLFDIQANVALDKFFPDRWKLKIPMFVSYEYRNVQPRFNPLDPDVPLQSLYSRLSDPERRTLQGVVEEFVIRRSINFANVRKERSNSEGKKYFFDLSNFSFNFAYNEEIRSNYLTSSYVFKAWRASVVYNYTRESKPFEPFKKIGFLQSPWFALLRDLNFNFLPNSILIKADLDRTFGRTSLRGPDLGGTAPLFEKIFRFNRFYDLQWNLTKSLGLNYNANANALVDEPFGDLNTQEKRDSVMNNLMRLGRMKLFTQQVGANYKLPFDKFPLTDFISGNATYSASYNWQAGAIGIADTMGNQIRNSRDRSLNGRVDMVKLYKKLKFLNMVETPPVKEKLPPEADTLKKKFNANNLLRAIVRPFLALRSINFTYTVQEQTTLPGFRPIPRFAGLDSAFAAPGWDFIFGGQDPDIRYRAADNGWLARSRFVNTPFSQNLQENLSIRALIEPIPDLRITVEFQRRQTAGYQEIFRFNPATGQHETQNPLRTGTYSVSFLSIFSAFTARDDGLNQSPVFQTFQNYREIIRQRLATQNPNAGEYGLNSQDVLIPAFLAAYGGQNPNSVSLASFPELPLPNWRLDYNGLNKLPFFKDIFATFNVTHSYSSLYTVGSFTSSLEYGTQFVNVNQNIFRYIPPSIVNAQNQFVSVNVVNGVSITERFAPLIGLDIKTRSNFTLRFDMNRERNLNLNLSNAQMAELRSEDFIIGIGYTKKNMRIPFFKSKGKPIILKNDFTFRLDFAIRETRTVQRKLDDVQTVTAGNQNIQIKPVISYVASNRLNLQLFYEFTLNTPRISSSFPRSNSVFGIQLRYNLTD